MKIKNVNNDHKCYAGNFSTITRLLSGLLQFEHYGRDVDTRTMHYKPAKTVEIQ